MFMLLILSPPEQLCVDLFMSCSGDPWYQEATFPKTSDQPTNPLQSSSWPLAPRGPSGPAFQASGGHPGALDGMWSIDLECQCHQFASPRWHLIVFYLNVPGC